jgi:hypothetical protein
MRTIAHIACVGFVLGVGAFPRVLAQTPAVTFTPTILPLQIDSSGSLSVRFSDMHGVHAYHITFSYDTALVRCRRVARLGFFVGSIQYSTIDSIHGSVTIDEAILGPGAQDGSGDVAAVYFAARHDGAGLVSIIAADLRDTLNQTISVSTAGAQIIVSPVSSVSMYERESGAPMAMTCYPNPCNPSTTIRYTMHKPGDARLVVYTMLGREVLAVHQTFSEPGVGEWRWDGRDVQGMNVASGAYLVHVQTASGMSSLKLLLVR